MIFLYVNRAAIQVVCTETKTNEMTSGYYHSGFDSFKQGHSEYVQENCSYLRHRL